MRFKVVEQQIFDGDEFVGFEYDIDLIAMGNCNNDTSSGGSFGEQSSSKIRVSHDGTLLLPDFEDMKTLINKKTTDMNIDITRSQRGATSSDLSLILPACKPINSSLIIKYFLVYSFYIGKYTEKGGNKKQYQNLFYQLLEQSSSDPKDKQSVDKLKAEIQKESNEAKQSMLLLNYAFKIQFILESLNKVLLLSKDPIDLGYFIFPIFALHNGIKISYPKANYNKRKEPIYIVAVLSDQEIKLIKKMENQENFFFFSAFMRGFTDQDKARQAFKTINKANKGKTFIFVVNFPYDYSILNQAQNNGFHICQKPDQETLAKGDVIFNIMSSFKLNSKTSNFQYDIDYGELAYKEYKKQNDRDYGKEPMLLKIYELCRGVSKYYLKSQSCLFRIISNNNQSLGASNLILSGTKTNNTSVANDIERQNLVNTHIEKGELDEALKIAGERTTLIFRAKKIQILYERNKKEQAKQEIAKISDDQKKKKDQIEARIIIDLIAARLEMSNSEYKKAHQRLKSLYESIKKIYPNDFEYIGRDVVSALMQCQSRGNVTANLQQIQKQGNNLYSTIGGNSLQLSSMSVKNK